MTVSRDQRIMRDMVKRYCRPGTSAIGWSARTISRARWGRERLCVLNVKAVENVGFASLGIVASERGAIDCASPGTVADNGCAVAAVIVVCAKLDHSSHSRICSSTAGAAYVGGGDGGSLGRAAVA